MSHPSTRLEPKDTKHKNSVWNFEIHSFGQPEISCKRQKISIPLYALTVTLLLLPSLSNNCNLWKKPWLRGGTPSEGRQGLCEGWSRSSASSEEEDELEKSEVELLLWCGTESEPDQAVPLHLSVESSSSSSRLDSFPPTPNPKPFFTMPLYTYFEILTNVRAKQKTNFTHRISSFHTSADTTFKNHKVLETLLRW